MATWVGYPRSYTKGRLRPVQYVVIHSTAGPEGPTSAEAGAAYDKIRVDGTSTHLMVDSNSALREVPDSDRAHHARQHGNQIGLGVELCGGGRQTDAQWHDAASLATMRVAAREVARMCFDHDLPVRRLSVAEVRAAYYAPPGVRPKGICGHIDVTRAYPEDRGDHTDPGPGFPWTEFLGLVTAELAALKGEDDMELTGDSLRMLENLDRLNTAILVDSNTVTELNGDETYPFMLAQRVKEIDAKLDKVIAALTALTALPVDLSPAAKADVRRIVDEELDEQSRAGADQD